MIGHRTYLDVARTSPVRRTQWIAPRQRGHRAFLDVKGTRMDAPTLRDLRAISIALCEHLKRIGKDNEHYEAFEHALDWADSEIEKREAAVA